ncbi:MAG: peptide chain release factor N(5)-glutamine methyltransferase [Chloroflexota bacterium]
MRTNIPADSLTNSTISANQLIVGEALKRTKERLAPNSETPSLDAQVLLAHILSRARAWVLSHPEATLTDQQQHVLNLAVYRLENGEPLPYLIGKREFYGLDFSVNHNVLIPRPETELLVDQALEWLHKHPGKRRASDVGTGSGCIAVSLAVGIKNLQVIATDICAEALDIARANAQQHGVTRQIHFIQCDLLPPVNLPLDLVCANLPYIPQERLPELRNYGQEPALSLNGGPDGLTAIRRILKLIPPRTSPEALILLEIDHSQATAVTEIARQNFPTAEIHLTPDLGGYLRILSIQLSHP